MNKLYCHIKVDLVILPWYLSIFWVVQSWIDERQKTSRLPFQWHVTILFCWRYFESPFSSFFFSKDSGSQALPFLSIPHVNLTVAEGHQLIDSWYSSYQKNMMSFTKESLQQVKYHTMQKPVLNSLITLPGINLKAQIVTWQTHIMPRSWYQTFLVFWHVLNEGSTGLCIYHMLINTEFTF